jgi:hypothetical protein
MVEGKKETSKQIKKLPFTTGCFRIRFNGKGNSRNKLIHEYSVTEIVQNVCRFARNILNNARLRN